jgi:hypothetical protein
MYSYRHFTPGRKSTTAKIIHSDRSKVCMCDTYDKFTVLNNPPNISRGMRIAQTIRTTVGGTTRFGNNYIYQSNYTTNNVLNNDVNNVAIYTNNIANNVEILENININGNNNIPRNRCVEQRAEICRTLNPPRNKF